MIIWSETAIGSGLNAGAFLFDANLHAFDELSEKQHEVEHKSVEMYDFGLFLFDFYLTLIWFLFDFHALHRAEESVNDL